MLFANSANPTMASSAAVVLSTRTILRVTNDCIARTNEGLASKQLQLRRAVKDDAPSILKLAHGLAIYEKEPDAVAVTADNYVRDGFHVAGDSNDHSSSSITNITSTPLFHCLLLEQLAEQNGTNAKTSSVASPVGMALWFVGYSSWEGPFIYLEDLYVQEESRYLGGGKALVYTLADITQRLDCKRLVWQVLDSDTPARDFYAQIGSKILKGTLTLRLRRDGIDNFLSKQPSFSTSNAKTTNIHEGPLASSAVDEAVDSALRANNAILNKTSGGKLKLRRAKVDDIPDLLRLTQGLADYVKEPDAVKATTDMYNQDGFAAAAKLYGSSGDENNQRDLPLFQCIMIEETVTINTGDNTTTAATPCGIAIWYFGYSTWEGRYVYLEDLFVEPALRGPGAGTAVMYALAAIAKSLDGARFVWQTLDWMSSARSFYTNTVRAETLDSWLTVRMDQQAITAFLDTRKDEAGVPAATAVHVRGYAPSPSFGHPPQHQP
jgi:GNAT superfamily N-acetyltransferase